MFYTTARTIHKLHNYNLIQLQPNSIHRRDKDEGGQVFATPSIALASCFLFRWDDSWVNLSTLTSKQQSRVVLIIGDKERFLQQDKGGSIYLVPPQTFKFDPNKGLGCYEGVSPTPVTPYGQINFDSALHAMATLGVEIYFVTAQQFAALQQRPKASALVYLEQQQIAPYSI